MKLQEYRSKEILARHGVPLLAGETATAPEDARAAAERIGGPVVVKAQVLVGGRGKAGGVKLASTPDEAEQKAREILGLDIKGITVRTVLVAPAAEIAHEYYLGLILDRAAKAITVIASAEGGVEIEETAEDEPRGDPAAAAPPPAGAPGARVAAHRLLPGHPRRAAQGLREGDARPVRRLRRLRRRPGRDQPAGGDRRRPAAGARRQDRARRLGALAPSRPRGDARPQRGRVRPRSRPARPASASSSWTGPSGAWSTAPAWR